MNRSRHGTLMGLYDRDYAYEGQGRPGFGNPFTNGGSLPSGMSGMSGWSINTWIIVINVAVFFVGILLAGFMRTPQGQPVHILTEWGHFSTYSALIQKQVWRFITFQFLHAGFLHILFNMLGLYWFGPQVEKHLGSRRYLAFYLLCGCAGACLYLLLNVAGQMVGRPMPFLLVNNPKTPLIGASAGVFGVLFALAYLRPNQTITLLLMLIIPVTMKIRTLAYGLAALALVTVYMAAPGSNAGGEAGHLGGAMLGALLIRYPKTLNWALWIPLDRLKRRGHHAFGQFHGSVYQRPDSAGTRHVENRRYGSKGDSGSSSGRRGGGGYFAGFGRSSPDSAANEAEIDRILSKIATQGLHSLTDKERKTLKKATDDKRRE
ncbi:MAG: rhomboid family intramembrane serine protease [Planctomycetes bacterium]|nr:rhomboid family intramembrane serine protease [Planctomycetota bacterium]